MQFPSQTATSRASVVTRSLDKLRLEGPTPRCSSGRLQ